MVPYAIEGFRAEVQRLEDHVGPPHCVVVAAGHVGAEGILAGVPARTVAAVVAQGDGFGEVDVEPAGLRDRRGDLRDLERVRETRPLMVVREDKHLRLAGEAPEGAGVQDPVAVALEARADGIGLLRARAASRGVGAGRALGEGGGLALFASPAVVPGVRPGSGVRSPVGEDQSTDGLAGHGRRPPLRPSVLAHFIAALMAALTGGTVVADLSKS